jgi:5'-nucleotidase
MHKTLYIDMDGVLVDFKSAYPKLKDHERAKHNPTNKPDCDAAYDEVPGIFSRMDPVEGALEAFELLSQFYDTYILSTAPWENPSAWSDKLEWVKTHLGSSAYKRLILSHNKHLNYGDYLIDDRDKNGADCFGGELIRFGSARFPDWTSVVEYLR